MTIRMKLIGGLLLFTLLVGVVSLYVVSALGTIQEAQTDLIEHNLPFIEYLNSIGVVASNLLAGTTEIALLTREGASDDTLAAELEALDENNQALAALVDEYLATVEAVAPDELDVAEGIAAQTTTLTAQSASYLSAFRANASIATQNGLRDGLEASERRFLQALDEARAIELGELEEQAEAVQAQVTRAFSVSTGITVVAVALAVGLGLLLANNIAAPIIRLRDRADLIARGELKQRLEINTQDEIGQLARSFNNMSDTIDSLISDLENRAQDARTAQARAEQSDRVKSAFLASMSHELRTPLNSIINFSKFVLKGVMGPINERQAEALNSVVNSAKHLLNLINDVLDMSKIESGSLKLFIEDEIDLGEIMATVLATANSLVIDKPVTVVAEIAPDLPRITADRQRVLQIMLNIVSNACRFTDSGQITIRARAQGDQIALMVRDTGPGIPLDDQEAVFQPFQQTESGLRQGGGTGLGMPISRSLAQAHGGKLWLESRPGEGATFHVMLPVRAAAPELMPI